MALVLALGNLGCSAIFEVCMIKGVPIGSWGPCYHLDLFSEL